MEIVQTNRDTAVVAEWLGNGSINMFGLPFAGKDTQGGLLAAALHAPLIGGGDILRNSVIPDHVRTIMERGELIPTEDYLTIVLPYLSRSELEGKPLVLSAVGRWSGEEEGVIKATAAAGHPIKAVISLNLDEREIWRRFEAIQKAEHHSRGKRHDDAADAIETRLEEFRTKTIPVIEFYRSLGLVIDIDSTQPIEDVHQEIMLRLAGRAAATNA